MFLIHLARKKGKKKEKTDDHIYPLCTIKKLDHCILKHMDVHFFIQH